MNPRSMRIFVLGVLLALPLAAVRAQDNPQAPRPEDGIFYKGSQGSRQGDRDRQQRMQPEQRRQQDMQRRHSDNRRRPSNRQDQHRQRDRASVPN